VGFENELIGQSNFPHSHPREVPRAWLIFPNRQVLPRRLRIPSWNSVFEVPSLKPGLRRPIFDVQSRAAASGPEYAVNGAVYARSKAWHAA
jgi:hypothetical protein